ncbi:MAG TPA: hypothetical protein VHR37_00125, partial [Solirubrobacterales bacterium]|nr:hypothetical protein [Solirubrobacterales bacterium]
LDAGARTGDFELTADALTIARGLVGMEDGLGLQVVIAHPAIDRSVAEEILVRYAETAIGAALPESPSAAAAANH